MVSFVFLNRITIDINYINLNNFRKQPDPETIYLRHVEHSHQQIKGPEEEKPTEPPKFSHPLRDIEIIEGTRAHFEAKLTPLGDATMKVEWLIDGKPLAASKTIYNLCFGYKRFRKDTLNIFLSNKQQK